MILLAICRSGLAEIQVSVDRSPVIANESFELTFESDEQIDARPDFSTLEKSFTVLNRRTESSTRINNGNVSHRQKWILTILTGKTGSLTIPAVTFGNTQSHPVRIEVLPAPPSSSRQSRTDDIFIDVAVDTDAPYVQAQIIYTVRLFLAVRASDASLSDPVPGGGDAVINRIGQDKNYEKHQNGKRYRVIERRYAIFPQSSGKLVIKPLVFKGRKGTSGFFNFDPFGAQPETIVKHSDEIVIDVKPIPPSFQGKFWLPATQLSLQEQWSLDPSGLKQGEVVTRTLILRANGLTASQLPDIDVALPEGLKTYPDQPLLEELYETTGVVGVRRGKMAIIPTRSGERVLPSVRIPWWNVKTDRMETAELPERRIHVVADKTASPPQGSAGPGNDVPAEHAATAGRAVPDPGAGQATPRYWQWASAALFILWLATLLLWWRALRDRRDERETKDESPAKRACLRQLRQACRDNNPEMAKNALLRWARANWPESPVNNLEAIGDYGDDGFREELHRLSRKLYADATSPWDGQAFLQGFMTQSFRQQQPPPAKTKLEPLYKT